MNAWTDLNEMHANQDTCLFAIEAGKPLPARAIAALPPWRALMMGRVAAAAGVPLEGGTLEQLLAEAKRVGGDGRLAWPPPNE